MKLIAILIASHLFAASPVAQPKPSLDDGYRDMYNLQFQAAHQVFEDWQSANPEDPLGPVSDAAAYLFAVFYRLHVLESELFTDNNSFENLGGWGRELLAEPAGTRIAMGLAFNGSADEQRGWIAQPAPHR